MKIICFILLFSEKKIYHKSVWHTPKKCKIVYEKTRPKIPYYPPSRKRFYQKKQL